MKIEKNIPFWLLKDNCNFCDKVFGKTKLSYKCGRLNGKYNCGEVRCPLINNEFYNIDYVEITKKIIENGDSKLINMTPI